MKRRALSFIMVLVLVLGMALTLATPVGAATPPFTGDVPTDFTGPGILTIPDPGGVGDVGLPFTAPGGTVSGWDMADLRLTYDEVTDTLYVGINTYGIAGDADGDGDPGGTSAWLAAQGGTDNPDLGGTETIAVYFDLDKDGEYDVIAGVPGTANITGVLFTCANFTYLEPGHIFTPPYNFGNPLPGHVGSYHANPSAAASDFEFTILNFSTLPGQNALLAGFIVGVFMGSQADAGIGEDSFNYEQNPHTITTIVSSAPMVVSGGSVTLTVTEYNSGNVSLTSPQVAVTKDGAPLATLVAPPSSGDNGNNILDIGETWTWSNVPSGPITVATTFEALGFGTDSLLNEVSYATGHLGERDTVRVDVRGEGCLQICKFQDSNVNGMWDPGEPWLPDWRFHVTGYNYDRWVTTGPDGCVVLLDLVSGTYTVTEELKAGWYNTKPGGDPPYEQDVYVGASLDCARVEFGNREEIRDIPPNIPAMNNWGIIAMITLFTGLLVWTVRRKRLAS